jgi:uncharacterized protein YbjQ (UPF0145 family)
MEPLAQPSPIIPTHDPVYTGLSGNEMYCLDRVGFRPGNLLVGNSVYSLGFVGGIRSGVRNLVGGEVKAITEIIAEGRRLSFDRLESERSALGAVGVTGVSSELIEHVGNVEFLSVGSALHSESNVEPFTSSADGQELYCQIDAGFTPRRFVFGNVAYSLGIGRGIVGSLRTLARGEVKEYTDIFNTTRNLALQRIIAEAASVGANSVLGIKTSIVPFGSNAMQEMLMVGTASFNPKVGAIGSGAEIEVPEIITSDLTCEELWNVASMGYVPLRLVLGTSVYSLGIAGGIGSFLKSFTKGEITQLTTLIYDAREESLAKVRAQAAAVGADDVLGIKTYVYQLGSGVIEFLAIGTAVKRVGAVAKPKTENLIPQAIIRDKDTFVNLAELAAGLDLNAGGK